MKLSQIAHIHSGVYTNTISEGEVYYIQARDLDDNRELAKNLSPTLSYTENLEKHFLQKGDVLIVAKGASFLSAVFDASYSPAVASTVFLVIRFLDNNKVIPAYLSWYLNLSATQSFLMSLARGSSIPSINKKIISDLEIPMPTIEKQKIIVEFAVLARKEKEIQQSIHKLKENQNNQLILNAINN